jgi:hypothetical protein
MLGIRSEFEKHTGEFILNENSPGLVHQVEKMTISAQLLNDKATSFGVLHVHEVLDLPDFCSPAHVPWFERDEGADFDFSKVSGHGLFQGRPGKRAVEKLEQTEFPRRRLLQFLLSPISFQVRFLVLLKLR